jgi:hypothetical protein
MSSNEPWRAVQPSASASTGQDPLAEAFKSAVNAFGRPDRMANYLGGLRDPHTTRAHSSVYLPRDSLDQSHPVTPEQSRTAGIPTTNLPSVSNMTDAAHQRLPTLSQVATQGSEPKVRNHKIMLQPSKCLGRRYTQLRGNRVLYNRKPVPRQCPMMPDRIIDQREDELQVQVL